MADTIRIVVYGSSLYIAGLAVSLTADPLLEVTHIPLRSPATEECSELQMPAAIILDLNEVSADLILSHLQTYPGTKLIGVDLANEDILLLSGHRVRVAAIADMIRLVAEAAGSGSSSPLENRSAVEKE